MKPNHAYYKANEGRWIGTFRFEITNEEAMRDLALLDRIRVRLMVFMPKLLGAFTMKTSVAYDEKGIAIHTTRILKWGMPLYSAVETFTLDDNGHDVSITREQRMWPSLFFTHEEGKSRARVDDSGMRADYDFPMFGVPVHQIGTREDARVRIVQEARCFRAEVVLARA